MFHIVFRLWTVRTTGIKLHNLLNIVNFGFHFFINPVSLQQEVLIVLAYSRVSNLHLIDLLSETFNNSFFIYESWVLLPSYVVNTLFLLIELLHQLDIMLSCFLSFI